MPVLRQITTCPMPAAHAVEGRSRKAGRALEYQVKVCTRHRSLTQDWPGRQISHAPDGRCGTVLDHRAYEQVVQSHGDQWIGPLTTQRLRDYGGDVAAMLRAAHDWLAAVFKDPEMQRYEIHGAVVTALDHAARLAEAVASGRLDPETGKAQVLAALGVAETIDVVSRGA
ncbi:hypothetical protein SSP35_03_03210 [Streptomyces sp. NBRC 110611]|uniref:hypothetical protein n=1 Tax=Streptomyces sp. NBRC 110611 TaxID=1621259 RepID=UPI0008311BE6|nr:hypothetical protein [Streptomyces sp. NBRC 110611]GAU66673.1 hypothetical protein SSP35_03_03210 [Streptomyces sp. NBRC 110611]